MQVAQDGVQLADPNYQKTLNKPFYMAPANRVDLLVKAPKDATPAKVLIRNPITRSDVPVAPDTELLTVEVAGPPVTLIDGKTAEMQFLGKAFELPEFLGDITDKEMAGTTIITRTLVFNSKPVGSPKQHTINGLHFDEGHAEIRVLLGVTEEWKIVNTTSATTGPRRCPHRTHRKYRPSSPYSHQSFPGDGSLRSQRKTAGCNYRIAGCAAAIHFRREGQGKPGDQCFVDPMEGSGWQPCAKRKERMQAPWVWHDVFAIPSAAGATDAAGNPILDAKLQPIIVPGYYKMRSRFVDYPGLLRDALPHSDSRGSQHDVQRRSGPGKAKASPAPLV